MKTFENKKCSVCGSNTKQIRGHITRKAAKEILNIMDEKGEVTGAFAAKCPHWKFKDDNTFSTKTKIFWTK